CITDDQCLLEDVLDLAADIGIDIEVAGDPQSVRRSYSVAPFVMIGDRSTDACARAALPRRSGVLVVTKQDQLDRLRPVARLLGAERVVQLPQGVDCLIDRLTAAADQAAEAVGEGRVVAVLGGRGGAGASVFAAGLAVTAGRAGLRALLVDADPLGGGVD